jgi:hypothetical protein
LSLEKHLEMLFQGIAEWYPGQDSSYSAAAQNASIAQAGQARKTQTATGYFRLSVQILPEIQERQLDDHKGHQTGAGTPGRIRTYDLELRSLLLYPTELPGLVRDGVVETPSQVWKTCILTVIRIPQQVKYIIFTPVWPFI